MTAERRSLRDAPEGLRLGIHAGTFQSPLEGSTLAGATDAQRYRMARDAGFTLVQDGDDALAATVGLATAGAGRVLAPEDAGVLARRSAAAGHESTTLHVGTGFESDEDANALIEAILEAAVTESHPMFVETHRATITQDPWRTIQLVKRYPDLLFTGDFSHWYTGVELVYGDLDEKLDALQPVFDRVRFLHGRVGTPGCMQVPIAGARHQPYVGHFFEIWARTFASALSTGAASGGITFVPELLPPDNFYAREFPRADGAIGEESDRWTEAILLAELAIDAFDEGARRAG
ncbi:hypothetical protein ACX9R5_17520 [Rathayibacter sp. CAU 1779]